MRPLAIARKSVQISLAVPGTERNLTRLNAPATAIPVPMLPLTIMMITLMIAGSSASVMTKLLVYLVLYMYVKAITSPRSSAVPVAIPNCAKLIAAAACVS